MACIDFAGYFSHYYHVSDQPDDTSQFAASTWQRIDNNNKAHFITYNLYTKIRLCFSVPG